MWSYLTECYKPFWHLLTKLPKWLLANFGMLQRAPETFQRAIKPPRFIGHVKLHGKYYWGGDESYRLYCMVDVTNIDILEIMWNSWKSDISW